MKKLLGTAHVYMIAGVVSGLYYRELTKAKHFTGQTQLKRLPQDARSRSRPSPAPDTLVEPVRESR